MRKKIIELLVHSGMLKKEQGSYIASCENIPVKAGHLYTYNSAQLSICLAVVELEKIGADVELTLALCDLQNAQTRLTNYLINK